MNGSFCRDTYNGIELIHMIRKDQLQHSAGNGLSPAEQFYLLTAYKNGGATFADLSTLMRQSPTKLLIQVVSWIP
ncbi:hypothetical protein BSQ98_24815 [Serratia liquefaciens]|nr:hypothetical protein BSQ98_24815 [Serratia liquefaciens]